MIDFSEKGQTEESEEDEEILVKDSSGATKIVDIKTEIKKPDIKLVGKIDLDKTVKPKAPVPAAPKEVTESKPEKPVKKKPAVEKPKPVEAVTEVEEKTKSGIDIRIVGKIDLDVIEKEAKPEKKTEPEVERKKRRSLQYRKMKRYILNQQSLLPNQ